MKNNTELLEITSLLPDDEKLDYIADKFRDIMEALGLDLSDDSLAGTPARVAKMYVNEVFSGLKEESFPEVAFFEEHSHSSQMVLINTQFSSFCAHHFLPFYGTATIAYLPNKKLVGLSKIPRIVRYFARRPQLQEKLTAQISETLISLLETDHVAVSLSAQHMCVISRGIEDEESNTTTNLFRGKFESNELLRQEFFQGIKHPS